MEDKTLVGLLMFLVAALAVMFFSVGCNQVTPLQPECVPKTDCYSCVVSGCGWCQKMVGGACWSFKSEGGCAEPVGFTQNCTDGTAIFPDPVVNPIPYQLKRDGGSHFFVDGAPNSK